MEITGTILQIGTTKEYGSNGFKKREIVIETQEQYAQKILIINYLQDFSSKQQENYFFLSPLIGVLS